MTRDETNAIAARLRGLREVIEDSETLGDVERRYTVRGLNLAVVTVAEALGAEHARFDRLGFMEAAGYESEELRLLRELGEQS